MPAIATKTPLIRCKLAHQGNQSRGPRGQWPRHRLRSASARLPRRRTPHAALAREQDAAGPLATKAYPGYRREDVTTKTAPRNRPKTPSHAGGAR
jgi:hypothetical protein